MAALGAKIGYFTGDPLRLIEDAQILKPTVFASVPRGESYKSTLLILASKTKNA
jgi:hypothetical protein